MNPNTPTKHPDQALLGIDISKLTFNVCLSGAETPHNAKFDNNPAGFRKLDAWLKEKKVPQVLAGLEATGPYGQSLMYHLHQRGHQVAQLNPRHVKNFAKSLGRRVKTDALDAKTIARFIQAVPPTIWSPPSLAVNELQQLVRYRNQLLTKIQVAENQLGSYRDQGTEVNRSISRGLRREIAFHREALKELEQVIRDWIATHKELRKAIDLLRTIPGVGPVVAATILAEIPQITAFATARQVAAFAGLTPSLEQSGTSVRRPGAMSKEGSSLLRKGLYMAALNVVRRDNPLRPIYEALVARGKAKRCAIGAMMHRLLRIAFGVLKSGQPFSPERLQKAF